MIALWWFLTTFVVLLFFYFLVVEINQIQFNCFLDEDSIVMIVDHFRCTSWYCASSPPFFFQPPSFSPPLLFIHPPSFATTGVFPTFFPPPLFPPLVVCYHRHYHSLYQTKFTLGVILRIISKKDCIILFNSSPFYYYQICPLFLC